jgi:membrane fusion protein (multidrug efflux system)
LTPKLAGPVVLLAGLVWLPGCKDKEEAKTAPPPEVEVVAVALRDVPIYRDWVGSTEGEVNATISAQVSGYLLPRSYREGSLVTNGQVLFKIDPQPFAADLAKAKAQMNQAIAEHQKNALNVKRYKELILTQAISQQELDDAIQDELSAQAQVEAGEAAVQQAKLNLDFTTIRSPINGLAGLAKAQEGNLVGPSTGPLTTVVQIDPIRVYFSLSQQLLTELQERRLAEGKRLDRSDDPEAGAPLQLMLASGSVYTNQGRVRFANNQVDTKTGTIMIVGEFANPQGLLVPGMFVRVRAQLGVEKNALLVPQRAVTDMQGRSLIAVVGADNKVSIRPVDAGERVGQDWVIQGNVKVGERVVAEGIQKVREGTVVNPVPFGQQPAAKAAGPAVPEPKAEAKKP